ncbi:Type-1 restriction enzyme MjaXIP specificity protein [uncultured archaeon]|nr:Type-1 restriction enzyme MjaXIP specificity protein [uncultured archaeon]
MQRLLTKGIGHERFKEMEVGRVPEEWDVVKLGDEAIAKIRGNKTTNKFERVAFIPMDFVPESGIFIKYEMRTINDVKSFTYCEHGDLLLAKITPSLENGKQGIVPDNISNGFALATTEVFPISCKGIDRLFLFYVLKFPKFRNKIISSMIGTTGRQRASKDSVENLKLPLPPLLEQRRIAEILSAVDRKLALSRRRKEKLSRVKKGLMNELLTGRKRVKLEE